MGKISLNTLLTRAEEQFTSGKYENALRTYGLLLKEYPTDSDAQIGVYLCDIGLESADEAQALFDYYQIIKSEQDNAQEVMVNLLSTLDVTQGQVAEILNANEDKAEYKNGIGYHDFVKFIDARGSFKRAFEDIMFSTRVILKNKEEYVLFITLLIERGQIELATQFLDSLSNSFANDQEVYALYHKLKEYEEQKKS
jgi:thioredoxin-like negative regulator of GroEL